VDGKCQIEEGTNRFPFLFTEAKQVQFPILIETADIMFIPDIIFRTATALLTLSVTVTVTVAVTFAAITIGAASAPGVVINVQHTPRDFNVAASMYHIIYRLPYRFQYIHEPALVVS
jgi:hypothetical protein